MRTFPRLENILNNVSTNAEKLPTTNRTMNFRVTVRDNRAGAGGVAFDQTQVTVVAGQGPFRVTSPNTPVAWLGEQTVTWDVAGTTASPVSATSVDILLSADGGYTYDTVLASGTPNDGSESVTLPDISTFIARIKVQATGNLFFDVSDTNITIGTCIPAGPPVTDPITAAENRYLACTPGNPGQTTALRVTIRDMPPPYESLENEVLWVGAPHPVCESAGQGVPAFVADCAPTPGLPQNWFWAAPLVCDSAQAGLLDWTTLRDYCVGGSNNGALCAGPGDCPNGTCGGSGAVYLYHQDVVPSRLVVGGGAIASPAQFDIQAVDTTCSFDVEGHFSAPLTLTQAGFGDLVLSCGSCPCGPANRDVDIADIIALLNKFANANCAPTKPRAELAPAVVDFKIGVLDITGGLDAFASASYPGPVVSPPCP